MTTLHTLGQRLAQARRELAVRERRDITQSEVADAVGYSRTSVSEWEADVKVPREEALAKLADVLGVTPAYLRYGIRAEGSVAPDPALDRRVTDQEIAAARRLRDAHSPPQSAAKPKRRRGNG